MRREEFSWIEKHFERITEPLQTIVRRYIDEGRDLALASKLQSDLTLSDQQYEDLGLAFLMVLSHFMKSTDLRQNLIEKVGLTAQAAALVQQEFESIIVDPLMAELKVFGCDPATQGLTISMNN